MRKVTNDTMNKLDSTAPTSTRLGAGRQDYEIVRVAYARHQRWAQLRFSNARRLVNPQVGDRILEVGCALGHMSVFFRQFGAEVVGVDISLAAIIEAKKTLGRSGIQFEVGDACNMAFPDSVFDKVAALDIVEHMYQDEFEKMSREIWRVLKPGGKFAIHTPAPTHIIEWMKKRNWILKQSAGHVDIKSMERITATLKEVGFAIDEAFFTGGFVPIIKLVEKVMVPVPWLGKWFRYRICIRAQKPD